MIKALILDLNGVFLESEFLSERFEKKFGVPVDQFVEALKDIMAVARQPGLEDSFNLWKPHLDNWGVEIDRDQFFNFWFQGEHLVPELVGYANEVRSNGIKVFILSNNFKERTNYYRDNFPQIFNAVDGAFFSWENGLVKPDEGAYRHVLEIGNIRPEECLYFDDSDKNIEVARSLGIIAYKYEGIENTKKTVESFGVRSRRPEVK